MYILYILYIITYSMYILWTHLPTEVTHCNEHRVRNLFYRKINSYIYNGYEPDKLMTYKL